MKHVFRISSKSGGPVELTPQDEATARKDEKDFEEKQKPVNVKKEKAEKVERLFRAQDPSSLLIYEILKDIAQLKGIPAAQYEKDITDRLKL